MRDRDDKLLLCARFAFACDPRIRMGIGTARCAVCRVKAAKDESRGRRLSDLPSLPLKFPLQSCEGDSDRLWRR
jgi:hypothetical protein